MGHKWDKFVLLMWKNFLLQWRHPIQTIVEILAPILFASLLVLLRSLVHPDVHPAAFFLPFETKIVNNISTIRSTIPWSPWNPYLEAIMDQTVYGINTVHNISTFKHQACTNSAELDEYLNNDAKLFTTFAGIRFQDDLSGRIELTPNMSVTLRFRGELGSGGLLSDLGFDRPESWRTHQIFPVYQMPGPRSVSRNEGGPPSYYQEGFLMLQQELSFSIINHFKRIVKGLAFDRLSVPIQMQRFPHPKYTEDMLLTALQIFVGLIFMLSFVYTCISTVKIITTEKEKQLKEAMKIMGLPNWLHWTAWFLKSFIMLMITVIIMVVLLKAKWYPGSNFTIFTYSDPFVLFIFLALFSCATITFCFAISVFFTRANTASTIAGMAWFLSYFPYMFLQDKYDTLTLTEKILTSLMSNTAMAYGFQIVVMFEGIREGLQWHNIWKTTSPDDKLVLGHIMLMFIVDAVLYLMVAIYVEAVFPGEYGVPQPWYFPFTKSYWCGSSGKTVGHDYSEKPIENECYEKEPTHLQAGIKIKQLRKQFSRKKVAVRDLSLNMYKDQITVLLGHNGAGKTTTMSMLTGMITPSEGTAVVGGHDIRTDMPGVRSSLGLCPQHNILFDELTVKEHLYFYSRLKGLNKSRANEEISKYVRLLDLELKADALSDTLSGGMKRKLSVGIALCGDSSFVMCDEPTAGMDPSARRVLWDLLQHQKKGRTILLSTHFMDEADLLGDRIAIMAGGKLQCCGSSFFLKKKYGAGYHLIMDKSPQCSIEKVTALLKKYIPTIQVENNIGSELTYILNEEYALVFEQMLSEVERHSSNLGILSYGVSLTTLEEVFMKVGADHGQEEVNDAVEFNNRNSIMHLINGHSVHHNSPEATNKNIKQLDILPNFEEDLVTMQSSSQVKLDMGPSLLTGWALWRNQLLAMFMKRGLAIFRTWMLFLIQNFIPVLFLTLAIIIVKGMDHSRDLPNFKIDLDRYVDPVTVITQYRTSDNYRQYIKFLQNDEKKYFNWQGGNMSLEMIEETEKNFSAVYTRYMAGATFNDDNSITAWFNNQAYHSAPLALQMVINAIFRAEVSPEYGIEFHNHPLPFTLNTKFQQLYQGNSMGFQIAFNIGFSMAFVSSFYVMFYVRERISKSKHLQFVSGVEVVSFWFPSFICDILTFVVTSVCIIITLVVFQEEGFQTAEELARTFALLLCFGFSMLPMMYLASYFYDIPSTGYTKMTLINIFTGVAAFLVIQVLTTRELELEHVANILHWVFLVVPHYSLSSGMREMNVLYSTHKICEMATDKCTKNFPPLLCKFFVCTAQKQCCTTTRNYFALEAPGVGRNILFSCCVGVLLIGILLLIEYGAFEKTMYAIQNYSSSTPPIDTEQDGDVTAEKLKIQQALNTGTIQKYNLAMHNVTKYYKKFLAVNSLSLGVNQYECFGLLGVNGAGKTTTFKMMTGDIKISSGDAWVNGLNLKSSMKQVHQLIGYCPQFDALLDDLTCRETLIIFGLLRGITLSECKLVIKQLAHQFDFNRHLDKQVKQLSGGNKRKLSTALALIGDPSVLYLDEPTTGMDPATKRYLWNALCKVRDSGKCIVLTSHSMEECEALCTRLAIMVNGVFKCLGSTQHLKSKFSGGYTLIIKVRKTEESEERHNSEIERIEKFVKDNFLGATIREKHHELITFYITDRSQPWSKMFGIMERGKTSLNIEDYSLGQSSLEQVFLTFTKHQRDE